VRAAVAAPAGMTRFSDERRGFEVTNGILDSFDVSEQGG
jgi:hypothetical protein